MRPSNRPKQSKKSRPRRVTSDLGGNYEKFDLRTKGTYIQDTRIFGEYPSAYWHGGDNVSELTLASAEEQLKAADNYKLTSKN